MKTAKIKLYTAEELKEVNPKAYEKAKNDFEQHEREFWNGEIWESMKKLGEFFDIDFQSIDFDNRGRYRFRVLDGVPEELAENRRRANIWILNNYINFLHRPKIYMLRADGIKRQSHCVNVLKNLTYSGHYEEHIYKNRFKYETIEEIAEEIVSLAYRDADYTTEDEVFNDISDCNGYFYTANGELFGGRLEELCEAE